MAATMASTTPRFRPSEKLGTHSMSGSGISDSFRAQGSGLRAQGSGLRAQGSGLRRRLIPALFPNQETLRGRSAPAKPYSLLLLLPPGVTDLELYAGVDAGVAVSKRRAGDMDGVRGEIDGPARFDEVMQAEAELGREVEHAGPTGCPMRNEDIRRILVGRVNQPAGALHPGRNATRGPEIPAKNNGRDADAGEGPSAVRQDSGRNDLPILVVFIGERRMRSGSKRLPVGHDLAGILELAAQDAGKVLIGDHLAEADTCRG